MPDTPDRSPSDALVVLHIHSEDALDPAARDIDQQLTDALVRVEACCDVYQGLARICSPSVSCLHAVVVCVDSLLPPDMDFFSVLAQLPRSVPAFVYGHARSDARLAQAIDLGATSRVTEEWILSLSGEPQDDHIVSRADATATSDIADGFGAGVKLSPERFEPPSAPQVRLVPTAAPSEPPEGVVESASADPPGDSELVAPPQVPWQRRTGTARRVRPNADSEPAPALGHEPLLTNDEIKALLGDDVDDVADAPQQIVAEDDGGAS